LEEKKHNERNAGRKALPKEEKMVFYQGGLVPPQMLEFIQKGVNGVKGIKLVRVAIAHYMDFIKTH